MLPASDLAEILTNLGALNLQPATAAQILAAVRMMVRRDAAGVRLLTRNGYDWSDRFPLIAAAAIALKVRSCLIDGEAVACDADGLPIFDRLRYRRDDRRVFLYAFDLVELEGRDLRPNRSRSARRRSPSSWAGPGQACGSMSTSRNRATSSSGTPASSALKASSRSASARPTSAAVRARGSSSRTRRRPQ
jgi:ATP-dependent DNA ligase